jgi:glycerate-2-kinase
LSRLSFHRDGTVIPLIVSDVIGDPLDTIASGPTCSDSTTVDDAYSVLEEYKLFDSIPSSVSSVIEKGLRGEVMETLKKGETLSCNLYNILLATNYEACTEMELFFKSRGHNTPYLGSSVQGEAREVAKVIGGIARTSAAACSP